MHNSFSIVIPVYSGSIHNEQHDRSKTVQRAIKSVTAQQYPHWELIVVDDGCADGVTPQILDKFAEMDNRIRIIHKENEARAIARNRGMEEAKNDWLCWLDSDDEYSTNYLRMLNEAINQFPDYKIFNFGSIVHFQDFHTAVRPVFEPKEEGEGHEWFRSGGIGAGSFIFRRDLWQENPAKYRIPDEVNPYQFAATSRFPMRFSESEPYVDNPTSAFDDGVYRHGLSLGNPWGDDHLQFYLLTRDNRSKPLNVLLYVQYARSHDDIYEYSGEIFKPEEILNAG